MTEFGCCYCHARAGHEAGCAYTLPNADRAVAVRFVQPPRQLTMNRKLHWAEHARAVKAWRTAAGWHGVPHKHLPPSIVAVSLEVRGNARRDPANWAATVKPIVDGLVDAGCWTDDTPKYVTTIEPRLVPVTAPRDQRWLPLWCAVVLIPRQGAQ